MITTEQHDELIDLIIETRSATRHASAQGTNTAMAADDASFEAVQNYVAALVDRS